ncbi:hypothetical protein WIS52_17070 [Pseudonocardia nematodicida]|uniref:Uncharacterized protein n=1 Tax=Pseudonocardia nematodicida TaxID=1206997 RepID=A0ABV1KEZ6_9PSEU
MTAPPVETSPAGSPDPYAGAGVLSSIDDVSTAVREQDAVGVGVATAVAGLDTLGLVADPVRELSSAGVGWAIEHFAFLREPLDQLCGDPDQILARARDWQRTSRDLGAAADILEGAIAVASAGWTGDAGSAFARAATGELDRTRTLSGTAAEVADLVLSSASLVGTERAIVRDLIADFVSWLIIKLCAWGIAAAVSAGLAVPAGLSALLLDAALLAQRIARRIDDVVSLLGRASAAAENLERTLRLRPPVGGSAVVEKIGTSARDAALEFAKNDSDRRATASEWNEPAG